MLTFVILTEFEENLGIYQELLKEMEGDGPPPVRDQIRALPTTDKDCVLPCVRPVRTYKSNSTVISKEG